MFKYEGEVLYIRVIDMLLNRRSRNVEYSYEKDIASRSRSRVTTNFVEQVVDSVSSLIGD
jgi:hypothetical protein